MGKISDLCKKYFNTDDFYEILGAEKSASEQEVRKAYHKASLKVHPDRVDDSEKEEATEKFKIVGHIYSILSEKEKRCVYDETGCYEDDTSSVFESDFDWMDYWRAIFKPLTKKDYSDYEKQYKGSPAEATDLKKAYVNGKGCMNFILENVPFTNCEEEPRLREIIQQHIDSGELPAFEEFLYESPKKAARRRRKYEKEAEKAHRIASTLEKDDSGEEALRELLMAKQRYRGEQMDSFLENLATKYGAKDSQKKKKTKEGGPKTSKSPLGGGKKKADAKTNITPRPKRSRN